MKKLFNHTKKPYDQEDFEWDEDMNYEEGQEYYADGEDEEYYEGDASYEAETVYSDEAYEGGEFYEDEVYEDEVYESEVYEDEVYEEGSFETENFEEEYYESEEIYDDEEEYLEYEDMDDDGEDVLPWSAMPDKNIFQKIWYSLIHMSTMDRIVTTTGVLVLVLAIVTGAVYASARFIDSKAVSFTDVGNELAGINLIGEHGLTAVADAELARLEAANAIEKDDKEYEENEYTKEVTVAVNMTSIEKDLKVKFVNEKTNKLIANVPFSVTVTTPDGEEEIWTDDDMDGIIYKTGIDHGEYKVALNPLEGEKYEDYIISTTAKKVTVKKEIDYEKVDVSDEIKDESEVDAKEEDTKENDIEVESKLQDTVVWVESTKTVLDAVYTAVPKTTVKDPLLVAKSTQFMRTSSATVSPNDSTVSPNEPTVSPNQPTVSTNQPSVSPGEPENVAVTGVTLNKATTSIEKGATETLTATVSPDNATDKTVTWTSSDTNIASVDNSGVVTAVAAGSATITASAGGFSATCTVTVTEPVAESRTLTLDKTTLNAEVDTPVTINATIGNSVSGGDVTGEITLSMDKTGIIEATASAPVNGVASIAIVPKATGTVVLTVGIKDVPGVTATCTITVGSREITLDNATLSVLSGADKELVATINSANGTVTVKSSDSKIATATVTSAVANGKTTAKVVITGVAAGSATITVTHLENDVEVKKTCTVTVVDKDTKLVDADKNQLYVMVSDNNYREATYADYYDTKITTFYLKADGVVKYTGWQTIEGKLYYYDASGKKITGEQVIQGAKYTFASDGSLVVGNGAFGIDVSKWNGTIDWNAVKNSGVNYVIIRCGYRGSSAGSLIKDPKFEQNIKGATAAGIKVGIYFFSQAINKNEAVEEASMVLELIKGYKISYPVFLDVEASGGRADNISKETRTEVIKAFCETIQNSGYTAGVYANKSWLTNKIDTSQLSKYKIWLAQYAASPTYSGRYDLWQYSSTGRVSGISGNVDLNWSYLGY